MKRLNFRGLWVLGALLAYSLQLSAAGKFTDAIQKAFGNLKEAVERQNARQVRSLPDINVAGGKKGGGHGWPKEWRLYQRGNAVLGFDANIQEDLYIYFGGNPNTDYYGGGNTSTEFQMVTWGWGAKLSVFRLRGADLKQKAAQIEKRGEFRQYRYFLDGNTNRFVMTVDGEKFFDCNHDQIKNVLQYEFSSWGPGYAVKNAFTTPLTLLSDGEKKDISSVIANPSLPLWWQTSAKLSKAGDGVIEFTALGGHDINFFIGSPEKGVAYDVVLYGWGGTQSCVRKMNKDKKGFRDLFGPAPTKTELLNKPMAVTVTIQAQLKTIRVAVNDVEVLAVKDNEMDASALTCVAPTSWDVPVAFWNFRSSDIKGGFNSDDIFDYTEGQTESLAFGKNQKMQELWAVGIDGSLIYKYDTVNDKWLPVNLLDEKGGAIKDIDSISMSQDGILLILRQEGTVWRYMFGTKRCVPLEAGKGNEALRLDQVAVGNSKNIWGLKADTLQVFFHDGKNGWREYPTIRGEFIAAGSDGTALLLSDKGDAFVFDPQAKAWARAGKEQLRKVALADKNTMYGINMDFNLVKFDGAAWVPVKNKDRIIGNILELAVDDEGGIAVTDPDNEIFVKGLKEVVVEQATKDLMLEPDAVLGETREEYQARLAKEAADKAAADKKAARDAMTPLQKALESVELVLDAAQNKADGEYRTWKTAWRVSDPGQGIIHFQVNMEDGLYVGLSKEAKTLPDMVELVLFGGREMSPNKDRGVISALREKPQGANLKESKMLLDQPGAARDVFVVVDSDRSRVAAFVTRPEDETAVSQVIAHDFDANESLVDNVRFFSFGSSKSSIGIDDVWATDLEFGSYAEGNDITKKNYDVWMSDWGLEAAGQGSVKFTAVAWNDIRVAVGKPKNPVYEIVLWGEGNETFIRKADGTKLIGAVKTPNQHPGAEIDVEIKFDKKAEKITVFVDGQMLMETVDPKYDATVTAFSLGSGTQPVFYVEIDGHAAIEFDKEMTKVDAVEDKEQAVAEKAAAQALATGVPVDSAAVAKEIAQVAKDAAVKADVATPGAEKKAKGAATKTAKVKAAKKVSTAKMKQKKQARLERKKAGKKDAVKKPRAKTAERASRKSSEKRKVKKSSVVRRGTRKDLVKIERDLKPGKIPMKKEVPGIKTVQSKKAVTKKLKQAKKKA